MSLLTKKKYRKTSLGKVKQGKTNIYFNKKKNRCDAIRLERQISIERKYLASIRYLVLDMSNTADLGH